MEKKAKLKDGREVLVRSLVRDDLDRFLAYFRGLPPEDRTYLRADVTRKDILEGRIKAMEEGKVDRIVALCEGVIVADGALEVEPYEWKEDVAEIRLHVARGFQRVGLGMLMARELYYLAAERKVERVVVRMMRPQEAARRVFKKLGFREEYLIPEHVRDTEGRWQDMILMRCDLEDLWKEMELLLDEADWQSHR